MMPNLDDLGIHQLSVDDRIALARSILQSVIAENPNIDLTPAQLMELEERIEYDDAHPEDAIPWEEVEKEARARFSK
jgi:putative addiction module component (TIGR02574 family)